MNERQWPTSWQETVDGELVTLKVVAVEEQQWPVTPETLAEIDDFNRRSETIWNGLFRLRQLITRGLRLKPQRQYRSLPRPREHRCRPRRRSLGGTRRCRSPGRSGDDDPEPEPDLSASAEAAQ